RRHRGGVAHRALDGAARRTTRGTPCGAARGAIGGAARRGGGRGGLGAAFRTRWVAGIRQLVGVRGGFVEVGDGAERGGRWLRIDVRRRLLAVQGERRGELRGLRLELEGRRGVLRERRLRDDRLGSACR